jgi:hypothetical protein
MVGGEHSLTLEKKRIAAGLKEWVTKGFVEHRVC